ncbi:MAG: aminoglycoside phosphotransferase family protein [Rhodobiaceae bacterium]|nr:aminoglycoside phosphotransferase family protein [Rhodobiaceae bacterium]
MTLTSIEDLTHATLDAQGVTLPPPPWNEIGEGLWGIVYDLGDGSVLKLVRKRGGLGAPGPLIQREVAALKALGNRRCGGFDIPELLGHGDIDLPANPFVAPLEGWLRLSKLEGRRLGEAIPSTPDGRQRVGETLGAALADFHHDAMTISETAGLPQNDPILRAVGQLRDALAKPEDKALCDSLKERWMSSSASPVFLHGDVNLSNVLVTGTGSFSLLDFAECGMGAPHAEFRHFEERPEIRDAIFMGYQAASGTPIDLDVYYLAATVNALGTLYHGGTVQPGVAANDPRKGMRLRGMVRHCASKAGLEV